MKWLCHAFPDVRHWRVGDWKGWAEAELSTSNLVGMNPFNLINSGSMDIPYWFLFCSTHTNLYFILYSLLSIDMCRSSSHRLIHHKAISSPYYESAPMWSCQPMSRKNRRQAPQKPQKLKHLKNGRRPWCGIAIHGVVHGISPSMMPHVDPKGSSVEHCRTIRTMQNNAEQWQKLQGLDTTFDSFWETLPHRM
jgi:hypothetical protein